MTKKEFANGYLEALNTLDIFLTQEFSRKGALDSPTAMIGIFNNLIAKLHTETYQTMAIINEVHCEEEQSQDALFQVQQFMESLFNENVKLVDIREYIKQGGK